MNIKTIIILAFFYLAYLPYYVFGSSSQNILEEIQSEITNLVKIAKPSIVTISSKSSRSYTIPKDNGLLSFFMNNKEERTVSYNCICSGLIYNDEGYIITKSNDIIEYEDINVILYDGTQCKPIYIGQDQETGITVLKIEAKNIHPPKIGDSDEISIGSLVTIIGNSMGIVPTISFGLVSSILSDGLFQLSAIVSPGNSGSPVFNINGKVIGILAAQVEEIKGAGKIQNQSLFTKAGLVFSINKTSAIANEIIKSYKEQIGWIGIQLKHDSLGTNNLKLINVLPNSPAEKAGLKRDDILIKYNNISLTNASQLGELIRNTIPGSTIPICFLRDNTRLNVFVTVEKRKPFINRQTAPMKIDYERYYLKAVRSMELDTSSSNILKLKNRINSLEREIIQLKSILNKKN